MTRKTQLFNASNLTQAQLTALAGQISRGAVCVLPTDTVYGLGTGAYCEDAIKQLYELKNRPKTIPFQLLTASLERARQIAIFSPQAQRLAHAFWPGALTLIVPATPAGKPLLRGFAGLGIRVPGNNFLVQLLDRLSMPLACTSANLHGQAVLTQETQLAHTFNGKVDFIIGAGTLQPTPSSVVDMTGSTPVLVREGGIAKAQLEAVLGSPLTVK